MLISLLLLYTAVQLDTASLPSAAPGSEAGSSISGADEQQSTAATATGGSTAEATPSQEAAGGMGTTPGASSSGGVAATAAADGQLQQQLVVLFGGCLDLSSFLSLNRNYVQSREAWLLDMSSLT
jgi:hypothetical protein